MAVPITCFDDFYSNPDEIREWALSLEYSRESGINYYPGERTDSLHNTDKEFFNNFCQKLFSIFYNFDYENVEWICNTKFQKIYSFEKNFNNPLNTGWIHVDRDSAFAGVIYLNKNPSSDSGTSIFYPKSKNNISFEELDFSYRNNFYSNKNVDLNEYLKKHKEHNDKFELSVDIKNKYNRLICYDGDTWHKESNFCMENEDFRLTQVFFIHKLTSFTFPKTRVKNHSL